MNHCGICGECKDAMGGHHRTLLYCEWALDTIIEGRFNKVQTRGYAHSCVLWETKGALG